MADYGPTNRSVKFSTENKVTLLSDEDSESDIPERAFNKFQILNDSEELEETGNQVSSDSDPDDEPSTDGKSLASKNSNSKPLAGKKKNPRKKRNKTKSRKVSTAATDLDDIDLLTSRIEASVPHNSKQNPGSSNASTKSGDAQFHLLKLDMRNLIPDNELKRIFGKSVLKDERSKEGRLKHALFGSSSGMQRSRFVSSGFHDLRQAYPTSSPKMDLDYLMNDQESTINSSKAKTTSQADTKSKAIALDHSDRQIYFRFVHDKAYQVIHANFLDAAQRGHSERIIQNLNLHPTHVESLLQLSDMIRVSEDYKAAGDLVERALLIFERGFHPKFNMATANCRLSYKRPENRTFFITLFKHISYCNRRGLRKTPLEYSKLLLSLEPENDPLLASLLIDFYSIRSEEYDYLIKFVEQWKQLADLPNMRLSLALAHFLKSKKNKSNMSSAGEELKKADSLLQQALLLYPNFITRLLDVCSAEPDTKLKSCDFFDYSIYGQRHKTVPEPVELLISVYTHRSVALWKAKQVMAWFEQNVSLMVDNFASGKLKDEGRHLQVWSSFRGPSPRNLLRHIVLSDLPVKVPPSASRGSILDIDPYPPESIMSYKIQTVSVNQSTSTSGSPAGSGLSSLFLRSMLPSFGQGRTSDLQTNTDSELLQLDDPSNAISNQMAQALDEQLVLEQQLISSQPESTVVIERLQQSIHNVLSSLTSLLAGANEQLNDGQPDERADDERDQVD